MAVQSPKEFKKPVVQGASKSSLMPPSALRAFTPGLQAFCIFEVLI